MDRTRIRGIRFSFIPFFFSLLFHFLIRFLYLWGTPLWFHHFPHASAHRFLLALALYFLCCAVFFFLQLAREIGGEKKRFRVIFIPSFLPVPLFAFLVFSGISLQALQRFIEITDTAVWFIMAVTLFSLRRKSPTRPMGRTITLWLTSTGVHLILEILSLLFLIPGLPAIILRFLLFSLCSLYTGINSPLPMAEKPDEAARFYGLSPRERDVLFLLMEGRTNEQIGEELFISLSTVKTHVSRIFEKTGAKNRLEVAALCRN